MISVDGSNTLRSLPSAWVSPRKMRALVCFITCLTSGTIASSSWCRPSSTSCCRTFLARFVPPTISLENRFACPTTRIGRIVDVGLHHGGVHAHSAPRRQSVGLGQLHEPLVNLLDHLGPHRHAPTSHRLCIRRLAGADAGEVAVHQIGAHLALQHAITPVADV